MLDRWLFGGEVNRCQSDGVEDIKVKLRSLGRDDKAELRQFKGRGSSVDESCESAGKLSA